MLKFKFFWGAVFLPACAFGLSIRIPDIPDERRFFPIRPPNLIRPTFGIPFPPRFPPRLPPQLPTIGIPFPPRFPPVDLIPIRPFPTKSNIKYDHNILVPKTFRVGAEETVILNLYKYSSATVTGYLRDLPGRLNLFSEIPSIKLDAITSKMPIKLKFKVDDDNIPVFRQNQKVEMAIEVRNSGSDFTKTIVVDVTKESGYLFVQTDRPVYRPSENVEIRVYPLDQTMAPDRENQVQVTVRTPDGVGAYRVIRRLPPFGFIEAVFDIAEQPVFGTWSVEAKYASKGYSTVAVTRFSIRRYVLPSFNVKVDMDKNYFFVTDNAIRGYIRANYSYGEAVEGNYFFSMKFKKTPTSEPIEFFKRPGPYVVTADFVDGEQYFDIPMGDLTDVLDDGETLETLAENSGSIFIEATVNARADNVMESDITPDLPFLKSPFVIDVSKTPKYYEPGFTYRMKASIRDITTGKPAQSVSLKITVDQSSIGTRLTSNDQGEISTALDFEGNAAHVLTISTTINGISDEDQSQISFNVEPYSSPNNNYLQISVPDEAVRVGQRNIFITFRFHPSAPVQVRYVILARGSIIDSGINIPHPGNKESSQQVIITHEMVPSFRVVAYHMVDSEVVSASLWIDVVDQCKEELTVQVPEEVLPGTSVPFTIRGAPQAAVSVSGVDKSAYFLFDQERLNRELMFDKMESYDRGCVRSGGSDGRNVFSGAGLQFYGKSGREATSACSSSSSRSKRDIAVSPAELAHKLKQCERDGKREDPSGEDCDKRGIRCRDNYEAQYPGCWKKFRDACLQATRERFVKQTLGLADTGNEAEAEASVEERRAAFQENSTPWTVTVVEGVEIPQVAETAVEVAPPVAPLRPLPFIPPQPLPPQPFVPLGGGGGGGEFGAASFGRPSFSLEVAERPNVVAAEKPTTTTTTATAARPTSFVRSDFREALSWPTIQIKSNGEHTFYKRARDSITTFLIDAVGMHDSSDGFCVAPSTELRVFKDIFVQLNAPYSLKLQEQAQLKIVVFNYNKDFTFTVVVRVRTDETFCTRFQTGMWSELIRFDVDPNDSSSATLSVLPLRIPLGGLGDIDVDIRTIDNTLLDSIKKEILIEPEGEVRDTYKSYPLDLKTENQHIFSVNFNFPELFVANTRQCWIYGYTNFMGPSIEVDPITKEPRDIKSIFKNPYGCGEQNMLVTGPNVYAHMYLEGVNKIRPGDKQYEESVKKMQDGFNRQLQYRSERVGSRAWAVFTHYLPSTWLNAYVNRVFIQAKIYYTDMDTAPICNSLEWMLGEQQDDGQFQELTPPIHREMHGAVGGALSLTAYVLITLVHADDQCSTELNQQIIAARNKAIAFLERNKNDNTFHRTYGAALLAYALSLHDPSTVFVQEINQRLLALKQHDSALRQTFWRGRPASEIAGTDIHAYWYNAKPQAVDVEATAYALLTQIEMIKAKEKVEQSDLDLTRQIALWLISQRNQGGAFISTQDTVVGLQALATYMIWVNQIDPQQATTNLNVRLQGQSDTEWNNPYTFSLDHHNEGFRKEVEVPNKVMQSGSLTVDATGTGEGVLSYRCIYRTVVDEESCHFHITQNVHVLNANAIVTKGHPMKIKLTITISKPVGPPAEASIVDVGLLSGFRILEKSLIRLSIAHVVDGTIERYEMSNQNIILYLNRIKSEPMVLTFRMEQTNPVTSPQPAKINVYDYYEPAIHCGLFYSLPGLSTELRTTNCDGNEMCKCAEGVCPICRTRDEQLYNTTCLTRSGQQCEICEENGDCMNMFSKACQSNFAYIVNITRAAEVVSSPIFLSFRAQLVETLKLGEESPERNAERTFTTRNDCYAKCHDPALVETQRSGEISGDLYTKTGTLLMIMSTAPERSVDKYGHTINHYRLGEGTIMERVIPQDKCDAAPVRIAKPNLSCDDPNFPRDASKEAKCRRLRKIREACKNMERLKDLLRNGCD
ncbi:complement C3-like isoform X2 [Clavelina lepadiformis]|uniref:complement C3-like isoform X2 n=1 Tax=Clavelina lepadiformis TaxID=159417 RepID=UPI004041BF0F